MDKPVSANFTRSALRIHAAVQIAFFLLQDVYTVIRGPENTLFFKGKVAIYSMLVACWTLALVLSGVRRWSTYVLLYALAGLGIALYSTSFVFFQLRGSSLLTASTMLQVAVFLLMETANLGFMFLLFVQVLHLAGPEPPTTYSPPDFGPQPSPQQEKDKYLRF